jgi:hypothetical protein
MPLSVQKDPSRKGKMNKLGLLKSSQNSKDAQAMTAGSSPTKGKHKLSNLNAQTQKYSSSSAGQPLSREQADIKDLIEAIESSQEPEQRMRMLRILHDKVKKIQTNLTTQQSAQTTPNAMRALNNINFNVQQQSQNG